jgi:hypothetical protein
MAFVHWVKLLASSQKKSQAIVLARNHKHVVVFTHKRTANWSRIRVIELSKWGGAGVLGAKKRRPCVHVHVQLVMSWL